MTPDDKSQYLSEDLTAIYKVYGATWKDGKLVYLDALNVAATSPQDAANKCRTLLNGSCTGGVEITEIHYVCTLHIM